MRSRFKTDTVHTSRGNAGHARRMGTGHAPYDFIFVLVLLCVFAFGALMAVILASNTYSKIKEDMDSSFELRTPLSYVSAKIRQNDEFNSVQIVQKEGIDALVLETNDNNQTYQTWVYEYRDSLYEVYLEKGTPFQLEDGLVLIPSYGLEFRLEDQLLHITAGDHLGNTRMLSLALRTDQGGDSDAI